jgi:glycosyltransferase involved in cell wall biosynthesis
LIKKKKVVLSANASWNIYNFRRGLIKRLVAEGFDVVVVAPYDNYTDKLKKLSCKVIDIHIDSKSTNPLDDLKTYFQYLNIYRKEKPDIVLNFTIKPVIYSSLASSLLNIKVINTITGLGTGILKNDITTKFIKFLYRISQKNVYKIFFQNKYDMEFFIKEGIIDIDRADIVPGSGINTEEFKPINIEKRDNSFKFLLIARMLWDKGVGEYIKAAEIIKKKYSNVEFLLLGAIGVNNPTSIPKEFIEKWEKKGIVKYLGTTDNIKNEIAKADCIVLPSYREGTSRVLLESAAMEKPIIATDVPGCNNIVEDGFNGFLCKVKSHTDLADKMEKMLLLDKEERIKMGKRGREKIKKEFDEKIVINKYIKELKNLFQCE